MAVNELIPRERFVTLPEVASSLGRGREGGRGESFCPVGRQYGSYHPRKQK